MRLRRHRDERGTALVEFALVAPILFVILFGIIEFGFVFKDSLTLTNMTRSGVRTGAAAGNSITDPDADYEILSAINGASGALSANIIRVIIFDANISATPDAACLGGVSQTGGTTPCNVYTAADMAQVATTWSAQNKVDFECTSQSWDQYWCPSGRVVSQSAGPTYLGVYISAHHSNITGFFHSLTLSDVSVMRLEPQTF
jgi:Flp pilus assembly protein TadG